MIIADYVIHYGVEWLLWSMRSVADFVDEIDLFYSSSPSHGHKTDLLNPESRIDILDVVIKFSKTVNIPVIWHDCDKFAWEGAHRDYSVETCERRGAKIVLVVDADELWDPVHLERSLQIVKNGNARNYRVYMKHFWRSLKWVCDEGACPLRLIRLGYTSVKDDHDQYIPPEAGYVYHMGYAQSPELIKYKMSIHGHKNELRPGWYENIFLPWKPGIVDVHPTCTNGYWNPYPFVDDGTLELLCGDHPYMKLDIIE